MVLINILPGQRVLLLWNIQCWDEKFNLITNVSCTSLLICDMLVLILLNEFRLTAIWS